MDAVDVPAFALEKAGASLGENEPVYMVNLVRYREKADYQERSPLPPCSGREAYLQRYAPAFRKVAEGEDYGVFWMGNVRALLVSENDEQWDDIVIVRYASFAALRRILESPAYETEAAPHRRAALAKWKFIVTTQPAPRP
jgi:hypothetical protein